MYGCAYSMQAQEKEVYEKNGQIFIRMTSGEERLVYADKEKKYNLTVNPTGTYVLYSIDYDPYRLPREPQWFRVIDTKSARLMRSIPVAWPARYVDRIEWVDNDYMMLTGEVVFKAGIDVAEGKQVLDLWGYEFTVSHDKRYVVYKNSFVPLRGLVEEAIKSDNVIISEMRNGGEPVHFRVIYPKVYPKNEKIREYYDDLKKRHIISNGFAWSSDDKCIAFVEWNEAKMHLVVLKMGENLDRVMDVSKVELGNEREQVIKIDWASNIVISTKTTVWDVNPLTKVVKRISRIG
jgi:hypothetical protein